MDKLKSKGTDLLGKGKDSFMSKIKSGGAPKGEQSKFQFDMKIQFIDNLPISSGQVYVSWKRSSKSSNNGKTKPMTVTDKRVVFDHPIQMITTLMKTPKKTYESKNLSISVKEEKGKKGTTIGKTILDLADFTSTRDEQKKILQIKPKKGKSAFAFHMSIKTTELQMGADEEPATETDLNSNDGSDDEEETEDFKDDDDITEASSVSSTNTFTHHDPPHLVKTASSSSLGSASSTSSTPSKVVDTKKEKEKEKDREKERAEKEKEKEKADKAKLASLLGTGTPSSNSSASGDKDKKRIQELEKQVEDLSKELEAKKRKVRELIDENIEFEDKVKDLEDRLSSGSGAPPPSSSSNTSARDAKLISDLQDQLKQKDDSLRQKEIANQELVNKNKQLEREKNSPSVASPQLNGHSAEEVESLKREIQTLKHEAATNAASVGAATLVGGGTLELKRKIQELNKEIKDKDEAIAKLKSGGSVAASPSSSSPASNSQSINAAVAPLEKQIGELNKTISSQKQEIERLNAAASSAVLASKKSSSNESAELTQLKRDNVELKDKLSNANNESKKLRDQKDDIERDLDELKERLNDSQEREDNLRSRISTLEDQNDQLQSKVNGSQTMAAASLSLGGKGDKNKDKEREKADRQERENLEKQLSEAKKDLSNEREKSRKYEREIKDLKDRIRQLESQPQGSSGNSSPQYSSMAKSEIQEREENKLIEQCIYTQTLTFRDGVGACAQSLYTQLLDQNAFSNENTRLFNKVINGLTQTVEKSMDNSADLSYWISNISGLVHLIKDGPNNIDSETDPILDGILIEQEITSPTSTSRRTPSTNFVFQLDSLCREAYSLLLHNIYKKLKPKLASILNQGSCILDKKTNRLSSTLAHANDLSKICKILEKFMNYLKDKYVFNSIIQQFYSQTFHYISYTLLSDILDETTTNACSPSSGFKIKLSLSKVEDWVASNEERELLTYSRTYLGAIADAANLMVIDKSIFTDTESIQSAFTTLNVLQIRKLLEIWKPDQLSPDPIPSNVISMSRSNWNQPTSSLQLTVDPTILIPITPILD